MIEQLMQEWKVSDFSVAESIFKSRQRQLKQKGGAQLRQKMQVNVTAAGAELTATARDTNSFRTQPLQCNLSLSKNWLCHVIMLLSHLTLFIVPLPDWLFWLQDPEKRLARLKAQLGGQEPLSRAPAPVPRQYRPSVPLGHTDLDAPESRQAGL